MVQVVIGQGGGRKFVIDRTEEEVKEELRGESAYEIWLKQPENAGRSEAEFLRSLVGGIESNLPPVTYRHVQTTPSSVWLLQHNLGSYPAGIKCFLPEGTEVEGILSYPSANTVIVTFEPEDVFTGTAEVS